MFCKIVLIQTFAFQQHNDTYSKFKTAFIILTRCSLYGLSLFHRREITHLNAAKRRNRRLQPQHHKHRDRPTAEYNP